MQRDASSQGGGWGHDQGHCKNPGSESKVNDGCQLAEPVCHLKPSHVAFSLYEMLWVGACLPLCPEAEHTLELVSERVRESATLKDKDRNRKSVRVCMIDFH